MIVSLLFNFTCNFFTKHSNHHKYDLEFKHKIVGYLIKKGTDGTGSKLSLVINGTHERTIANLF